MESKTLLDYFNELTDVRRAEGKRHNLSMILIIVLMSTMSQYYGYRGIARFIKKNRAELINQLKPAKDRLPSLATLRRVILGVDFDELSEKFRQWASQMVEIEPDSWISMDGKSLRNTMLDYHKPYQNFVSIVSAYSHASKLVIGMQKHENKKQSEIVTVSHMIDNLGLTGVVFTMDALHSKKNSGANSKLR